MFHVKPIIKGVILDFNGTLYNDHDLNKKAWTDIFVSVSPESPLLKNVKYEDLVHTVFNDYQACKAIYKYFGIDATDKDINELSEKKEKEYRQLAMDLGRNELIKGIPLFLDYLKDNGIPYCIASMAPKSNFDFYLDYLHLDKWFDYKNIVYDDNSYPDKNSQVKEAARRLNLDPKDCLMVEDSPRNIKQAYTDLGIDKFIYVNSTNTDFEFDGILQEIKDFQNFDFQIFNK